jgi:hypothetical protein
VWKKRRRRSLYECEICASDRHRQRREHKYKVGRRCGDLASRLWNPCLIREIAAIAAAAPQRQARDGAAFMLPGFAYPVSRKQRPTRRHQKGDAEDSGGQLRSEGHTG